MTDNAQRWLFGCTIGLFYPLRILLKWWWAVLLWVGGWWCLFNFVVMPWLLHLKEKLELMQLENQ